MIKILTNSPKRKEEFQKVCNLPLPKHPVITRWCTWLQVSQYYIENFKIIKKFIENMAHKKSQTVVKLKNLVENPKLFNEMIELCQFKPLILKLKEIQNENLSAKHQIDIINELRGDLNGFGYALTKLNDSLSKNTDFKWFEGVIPPWAVYAPLTTVELESCFFCLESMLTDRRVNFTEENIEKFHFIKYNKCVNF